MRIPTASPLSAPLTLGVLVEILRGRKRRREWETEDERGEVPDALGDRVSCGKNREEGGDGEGELHVGDESRALTTVRTEYELGDG